MCILYCYLDPNPKSNGYKLILVNNRDEFYRRPTANASLWGTTPEVIGGIDKETGREGGTWLGINEHGKFASLLNIATDRRDSRKKGRGFLVNDFLLSGKSSMDYLEQIATRGHCYNPFNLVTVEILGHIEPHVAYYCNASGCKKPQRLVSDNGIYSFGNTPYQQPMKKLMDGHGEFESIVREYNSIFLQDELVENCISMMKNKKKHFPDPVLKSQCPNYSDDFLQRLSCRYVKDLEIQYGTRTHTVILIDANDTLYYEEVTMEAPVQPNRPIWTCSTFTRKLRPEEKKD